MAIFKVTCPECKGQLKSATPIPEGKTLKCPKCAMPFTVPQEKPAATIAPVSVPQPKLTPKVTPAAVRTKPGRKATRSGPSTTMSVGGVAAVVLLLGGGTWGYLKLTSRPPVAQQQQTGPAVPNTAPTNGTGQTDAKASTDESVPAKIETAKSVDSADSIPTTIAPAKSEPLSEFFFHDGRTDWKIYLSPQADPTEQFAAEELSDALKKISRATFEVVTADQPPAGRAIILGDLKNPEVQTQAAALNLQPGKIEQIAVYTLGDRLYLAGNQPRGVLYAVYHFLQHELGVRWLWPGPDGEFMPAKKSWTLPELKANHQPVFTYRGFHLCGDWREVDLFREWMGRNFINIFRHAASPADKRRGFYSMFSDHNAALPAALFEEHPEYFAEIQGKRYKNNLCFSNPEGEQVVLGRMRDDLRKRPHLDILSIFPSDNEDYCRCAKCAQMDVSTAWFEFYNRVTDQLKQEFPHLKFATIAYQGYRTIPQCAIRNSEFVEYASYSRCNVHPYGQTGCQHNEETLAAMRAWKATSVPIGNYSYEYDIYSQNRRFTPFFSVIEDAVKTSRQLGHISVIPEVLLHPKLGPDEQAHAIQNRLSIYLYARLLWNPDQPMRELLADWCQTVYGEAAAPMLEYFTAIDQDWTAMPIHTMILGNALRTASVFMTDKVRNEATAAFAATESRLPMIADPAARERAALALTRERVLINQWQDLHRLNTGAERLSLPLLAEAAGFPQAGSRTVEFGAAPKSPDGFATRVRSAWTGDSLLVKWTCNDLKINQVKALAEDRDGKVTDDDSVELELSSGTSGETWHLAVNSQGVQQDWRDSSVGVRDDLWNPQWQATARSMTNSWEVEMAIPFASLGQKPNPAETWQARFVRHNGGRADFAQAVFPDSETVSLLFNSTPQTERTLLWWSGSPEKEATQNPVITQEFTNGGWQMHLVSSAEQLGAIKDPCDAYWFRHPNGPNKVPADYWEKQLLPAINSGALAVFVSFLDVPLDQYFGDPSWKVKLVSCGQVPLAGRTTAFVAEGDWSKQPNDLQGALKKMITPAYGFAPAQPAAWTVLATANGSTGPYPYLLARRHGKGMIVLAGAELPLSRPKLLENLLKYQAQSP